MHDFLQISRICDIRRHGGRAARCPSGPSRAPPQHRMMLIVAGLMCVQQMALMVTLGSLAAAKQQLPHPLPEVPGQERVQERVDARVEVGYEEGQWGQQRAEVAAPMVVGRPMLPHFAGVEWQIAEGEGQNHDDQHPDDSSSGSEDFLGQVAEMAVGVVDAPSAPCCYQWGVVVGHVDGYLYYE